MSEPAAAERDRIWTIPNALSVLRLLGVPLFLYLLLGPHKNAWALVVLMLSGFTDWLDGVLARKLNQMSNFGALLDPLADRLYILATLVGLVLRHVIPLWLAIVIVGRDVVVGLALPVLRRAGYGPPAVHYLGKAATFCLLYAFPLLLIAIYSRHRARHRPAGRVGVHDLGHRAVPVVGGHLPAPGGRSGAPPGPPGHVRVTGQRVRPPDERSLASARLLIDLVTNTLDPGYAAAAERPRPPRWYDRPAVAAGCLVIGFLLVVAYVHTHRGAPAAQRVHDDLVTRVRAAQRAADDLARQVTGAEARLARDQDRVAGLVRPARPARRPRRARRRAGRGARSRSGGRPARAAGDRPERHARARRDEPGRRDEYPQRP